jgi:hypothetical protein
MARPRIKQPRRTYRVPVRLQPEEGAALERAAEAEGQAPATLARALVVSGLARRVVRLLGTLKEATA